MVLWSRMEFETFSVENAKCYDPNDKGKLLTSIEAAFGSYAPFNLLVRQLLTSASGNDLGDDPSSPARRPVPTLQEV